MASKKYNVNMNSIYYGNGSDTDFIKKVKLALDSGCKIMLGLYTSRECLLAGPMLKENKAIAVSPSCGHNNIENFYPSLFTGVPNIRKYVDFISSYLEREKTKEIFIVYQSNVYSRLFYKEFKKLKNKNIKFVKLDKNGKIKDRKDEFTKLLSSRKEKVLVFTTYPLSSSSMLEKIKKLKLNEVTIIGATSWVFDLRIIKRFKDVFMKTKKSLVTDIVDLEKIKKSSFYRDYKKEYLLNPDLLSVYSFDISSFVFSCVSNRGRFSYSDFLKCLNSKKYKGISGHIKYLKNSPFADREINFYDLKSRL